jgi:hypothetical protein
MYRWSNKGLDFEMVLLKFPSSAASGAKAAGVENGVTHTES